MQRRRNSGVPRKLQRLLRQELNTHISAHLAAGHLPHIRKTHVLAAQAKKTARKTPGHKLVAGLPIYSASLGSLVRNGLEEPAIGGWLLLVQSAPGIISQVEAEARNKTYAVTRVSTGALADSLKKALNRAASVAGRGKAPQLRALRVPAMHISAVWCHHPSKPQQDFLIPITANFAGLRQHRSYRRGRAEKILKDYAVKMILRWYERMEASQQQNQQQNRASLTRGR